MLLALHSMRGSKCLFSTTICCGATLALGEESEEFEVFSSRIF